MVKSCEQMYFYQSSGTITIFITPVAHNIPGGWDANSVPSYCYIVFQRRGVKERVWQPQNQAYGR